MKTLFSILAALATIGADNLAAQLTATRYGNTTYYSNGTTATPYGNTTYFNNGMTATRYGNTMYFNNVPGYRNGSIQPVQPVRPIRPIGYGY